MAAWGRGVEGWGPIERECCCGRRGAGVGKGGAEKCFALNVIDVQVSGLSLKAVMLAVTTQWKIPCLLAQEIGTAGERRGIRLRVGSENGGRERGKDGWGRTVLLLWVEVTLTRNGRFQWVCYMAKASTWPPSIADLKISFFFLFFSQSALVYLLINGSYLHQHIVVKSVGAVSVPPLAVPSDRTYLLPLAVPSNQTYLLPLAVPNDRTYLLPLAVPSNQTFNQLVLDVLSC